MNDFFNGKFGLIITPDEQADFVEQCNQKVDRFERILATWNKEHPEPRYPTWKEWQKANFANAASPCCIGNFADANCYDGYCETCMNQPIPEDIAKKLGIKPIGGK